jgi:hypothetical protein
MRLSYVATGCEDLNVSAITNSGSLRARLNFGDMAIFVQHEDIPELINELQKTYFVLCHKVEEKLNAKFDEYDEYEMIELYEEG